MRHRAIVLTIMALIIAGMAGAYIFSKSQTVMTGMSGRLETELSRALGGTVAVGNIEVASINKMVLYDVVISDGSGQVLAKGTKVTVGYNPLALLGGGAAMDAVRELTLSESQITLVRHADGRWNIDELMDKTRSAESAFSGKIRFEDCVVLVTAPEGQWRLTGIAGSLDFATKPDIMAQLNAEYDGAALELTGRISKDGASSIDVDATALKLEGLSPLLPSNVAVKSVGGKVTSLKVKVRRDKGEITYAGEARLDGVAADIAAVPLREVRGNVSFSDKQVFLFPTAAKVYGQDIEVRGKIATAGAEPVLDLTVAAQAFDPQAINQTLPVRGPIELKAQVGGTPGRPVVSGEARIQKGEIGGFAVEGGAAKFNLVENALTINKLEAGMFGGRIAGTGTILLDRKQYYFALGGQELDMAALPALGVELAGRGAVDLRLEGTGTIADARIAGSARMGSGQVAGVLFADLTCGFYKSGGSVALDYLALSFPDGAGALTAKGSIDNGRVAVAFFGQGIPLAAVVPQGKGFDVAGTADVEGTVTGTPEDPMVTARFTAYKGHALQQPFAVAKGNVSATKSLVTVNEFEAVSGPTSHKVTGSIALTGDGEANLVVVTRRARAENLAKLIMPGERITGNIDNEVVITGPLANMTAAGKVKLTEGSFRGQLIARAEGLYSRQSGSIALKDFVIDSLNAEIRLNGVIAADNQLSLDVAARDIDLSSIHVNFPYPVAGKANFEGNLSGTVATPVFNGEIRAKRLVLNGQELASVLGRVNISNEQLEVPLFGFSQGEGKFEFSGGINFKTGVIFGSLSAENGGIAGMLAVLNVPAKEVEGRLDGQVALSGTVSKPNIWLTGTLTKGKIKNYPLENIEVDVAVVDGIVTINRFYAKQGGGILAARGTAALNGPLNLEVGGRNLDAGLLTAWLDTTLETQGKLTFTAQVTGTTISPHAAVSLEIAGGGVTNATFDALYGLFILDKGSIHVNQLMLTKGPYRASAYGTVPLAALNREGRARGTIADQMDLKVRLEQANLSILPLLTKEVAWATGDTKGEVTISGTLAQPLLYGSVVVSEGTVKLKSFADPVQKVGVDIQFDGDKINIKTFDGRMGGGAYRLTGSAAINGLALADYRLLLVLDKLGVNAKYFKGPLDGTLTLSSQNGKPVLSGQLLFANTTANIPYVPEFTPSGIDVGLDLDVVVGKKVRLTNPYLYDLMVEGKVKFTGTLASPAASGRLTAARGTVNYLRTQFRVESASADFTQFGSFLPVVRLIAATKLEYTKVNLAVSGPLNAMEFRLSSEPGMSQQQILSLLTLRSRYADKQSSASVGVDSGLGREELLSLLDAGLQMTFVAEAESAFRKSLGLDEFRLVRTSLSSDSADSKTASSNGGAKSSSSADREGYNVEIGKYVTDKLFISYTLGVDHNETSAYFRYDINKRVSITGAIDEYNRRRIGVETRITF